MAEQQGQPEKKRRQQRKRRGHGEGSIYPRRDRSGYAATITLENGKRKTFYGKTYQEAQEKLLKARHEQQQGTLITEKDQTVRQYLEYWLEHVDKPSLRLGTYVRHCQLLRKHILPELGHYTLQRLSPDRIQALYTKKLGEGLAPGTIKGIHTLLHKALRNAVRWRKIAYNPCDAVTPPQASSSQRQVLTIEQAHQLLEAAKGHRLEVLLTMALVTGMRRGELIGLKWQDIDFERRTVEVRRTMTRLPGYGVVESEPKTASGKRTITLPPFLVGMLRQHRKDQLEMRLKKGPAWNKSDYVFCNSWGAFFNPSHLQEVFQRLLKDAGLAQMRFHDLRHSAATILLRMGVPAHVVKEILGHSHISITLGIYGHVLPGMHEEAMDRMGKLFGE
jgi:integrase